MCSDSMFHGVFLVVLNKKYQKGRTEKKKVLLKEDLKETLNTFQIGLRMGVKLTYNMLILIKLIYHHHTTTLYPHHLCGWC